MNGTGVRNQVTDTADSLPALGFNAVGVGDTRPLGPAAETVAYYGSRAPGIEASAEGVARSMNGAVILGSNPNLVANGAQVTVVTGSQFTVNPT